MIMRSFLHSLPKLNLQNLVCFLNIQTSQFGRATFPVFSNHMWLVATLFGQHRSSGYKLGYTNLYTLNQCSRYSVKYSRGSGHLGGSVG